MKMRNIAIAAAALMLTVSCAKEDTRSITASIAPIGGEKVYLDDNYACWNENGDQVMINGTSKALTGAQGIYSISLDGVSAGSDSTYYAIFPANAATSSYSESGTAVTLPAVQTYSVDDNGRQHINALMAAKGTHHLEFYNICSLLKVTVPANIYIARIEVSTIGLTKVLSGAGTINFTGDVPVVTMHESTTAGGNDKKTILNVGASREDGTFYVAVPPTANTAFVITIRYGIPDSVNHLHYYAKTLKQSGNTNTLLANQIGPVSVPTLDVPENDGDEQLPGEFTVDDFTDENGNTIYFSRGNLLYTGSTNADWTMENQQYETHAYSSTSISGMIPYSCTGNEGNDNSLAHALNEGLVNGQFVDWGGQFSNADPNLGHWGTLSSEQMTYLLNTREASTVNGVANARYALITVNDGTNNINGLLLFPDLFAWPSSITTQPSVINTATASTNWNNHVYSRTEWETLEANGCIFFPADGYVAHNATTSTYHNEQGFYWTSDPLTNNGRAVYFTFGTHQGNQQNMPTTYPASLQQCNAGMGCSVRLVWYPNPTTTTAK